MVGRLRQKYLDGQSAVSIDRLPALKPELHFPARFKVCHPWGTHLPAESDVLSEHNTIEKAFAAIDQLSAQMVRTGAPSDGTELVVVDGQGRVVKRPRAH